MGQVLKSLFGRTPEQTDKPAPTPPFNLPGNYYQNTTPVTNVTKLSGTVVGVAKDSLTLKVNASSLVTTPAVDSTVTPPPPPIGLIELTIRISENTKLSLLEGSTNKAKPTIAEIKTGWSVAFSGSSQRETPTAFDATELIIP